MKVIWALGLSAPLLAGSYELSSVPASADNSLQRIAAAQPAAADIPAAAQPQRNRYSKGAGSLLRPTAASLESGSDLVTPLASPPAAGVFLADGFGDAISPWRFGAPALPDGRFDSKPPPLLPLIIASGRHGSSGSLTISGGARDNARSVPGPASLGLLAIAGVWATRVRRQR